MNKVPAEERERFLSNVDGIMKNRTHTDIIRDALYLLKANWYDVWQEEIDAAYDAVDALENDIDVLECENRQLD